MAARLEALLPAEACRELVDVLEGYTRRALAGRSVPDTVIVNLVLSRRNGEVIAIEVPRRIGR
jgi:hypothetical protein